MDGKLRIYWLVLVRGELGREVWGGGVRVAMEIGGVPCDGSGWVLWGMEWLLWDGVWSLGKGRVGKVWVR